MRFTMPACSRPSSISDALAALMPARSAMVRAAQPSSSWMAVSTRTWAKLSPPECRASRPRSRRWATTSSPKAVRTSSIADGATGVSVAEVVIGKQRYQMIRYLTSHHCRGVRRSVSSRARMSVGALARSSDACGGRRIRVTRAARGFRARPRGLAWIRAHLSLVVIWPAGSSWRSCGPSRGSSPSAPSSARLARGAPPRSCALLVIAILGLASTAGRVGDVSWVPEPLLGVVVLALWQRWRRSGRAVRPPGARRNGSRPAAPASCSEATDGALRPYALIVRRVRSTPGSPLLGPSLSSAGTASLRAGSQGAAGLPHPCPGRGQLAAMYPTRPDFGPAATSAVLATPFRYAAAARALRSSPRPTDSVTSGARVYETLDDGSACPRRRISVRRRAPWYWINARINDAPTPAQMLEIAEHLASPAVGPADRDRLGSSTRPPRGGGGQHEAVVEDVHRVQHRLWRRVGGPVDCRRACRQRQRKPYRPLRVSGMGAGLAVGHHCQIGVSAAEEVAAVRESPRPELAGRLRRRTRRACGPSRPLA